MWGAGMGRATADFTTPAGWLIPVGVQFIPAAILLASVPFTIGKSALHRDLFRHI